jgi:lipoprotein-anchoring transpeptidase ErfK/SrfK
VRGALASTAVVTGLALVGCGQSASHDPVDPGSHPSAKPSSSASSADRESPSSTKSSAPAEPFKVTSNISDDATDVKINKLLKLNAFGGKLAKVKVTGTTIDHGASKKVSVAGELNADKTSWTASERLEPNAEYTVKTVGDSTSGKTKTHKTNFSTMALSLDDQIFPSFAGTMTGTVGVATPIVLQFDLPVKNRAAFEKHLHVTSTSGQKGSWHWYNDKEVHWRPAEYWKTGTKVTATADLNSLPAGNGLYGQKNASVHFTVGDSVITKVNLKTHLAKVYVNGKKARTIPISAGKPGDDTRSGTSVITQKLTDYTMTSEMIGLPKTGPESYSLTAAYAMRITTSGEFLHSAPWNAGYFGKVNASHGCVGMTVADSAWLFKHAKSGSPVTITGSKRSLDPLNGLTDWNVDFHTYAKGSAL